MKKEIITEINEMRHLMSLGDISVYESKTLLTESSGYTMLFDDGWRALKKIAGIAGDNVTMAQKLAKMDISSIKLKWMDDWDETTRRLLAAADSEAGVQELMTRQLGAASIQSFKRSIKDAGIDLGMKIGNPLHGGLRTVDEHIDLAFAPAKKIYDETMETIYNTYKSGGDIGDTAKKAIDEVPGLKTKMDELIEVTKKVGNVWDGKMAGSIKTWLMQRAWGRIAIKIQKIFQQVYDGIKGLLNWIKGGTWGEGGLMAGYKANAGKRVITTYIAIHYGLLTALREALIGEDWCKAARTVGTFTYKECNNGPAKYLWFECWLCKRGGLFGEDSGDIIASGLCGLPINHFEKGEADGRWTDEDGRQAWCLAESERLQGKGKDMDVTKIVDDLKQGNLVNVNQEIDLSSLSDTTVVKWDE